MLALQAEASAIAARRQADKHAEQELAFTGQTDYVTGSALMPGSHTPSRASAPQVHQEALFERAACQTNTFLQHGLVRLVKGHAHAHLNYLPTVGVCLIAGYIRDSKSYQAVQR